MKQLPENGYIALISVLIIGAVSLTSALVMLTTGVDNQQLSAVEKNSDQSLRLAEACIEEALQQYHDSTTYTGTNNLTLGAGTCSYTVTSTGSSSRTIDATATVNGLVKKLRVYATIGGSSISVTSWQDVP